MNTDPEPVVALVVAAGSGFRLGAKRPKALVRVGDRTLVEHSVEAMASGGCSAVLVVIGEGLDAEFSAALAEAPVPCHLVTGGATRQLSVRAGLKALDATPELAGATIVLVHDAARPFVPVEVTQSVIAEVAGGAPAVVPVVEVADTIRQLSRGDSSVLDRDSLRAVQTPQGFDRQTLSEAHDEIADFGVEVTDDAAVVEYVNVPVTLVRGAFEALKVTRPTDLLVAEAIWSAR